MQKIHFVLIFCCAPGIDGPIITGCKKKPDVYDIAVADGIMMMLFMPGFTRDKILNIW
jgi:hypothetical protein